MTNETDDKLLNQFVDELIKYRDTYVKKVEPDKGTLQPKDEAKLTQSADFKKIVISTTILHMLENDQQGGYWPMIKMLFQKAKKDIDTLIDYYQVEFKTGISGYHPVVTLKDGLL